MKEKYKYLTKNTFVFAISSFGTKFLSFFLVPLYTNILTTSEYGIADIITTTGTLMMYICTLDIAEGVLRFVIEKKEEKEGILRLGIRVLILGSGISILLLLVLRLSEVFNWPDGYYWLTFLYFLFTTLYQIYTNYLRAVDQVLDVAIAGIISSAGIIGGNIFFLLIVKIGMCGYLYSLILGPLLGTIYCVIKSRIKIPILLHSTCTRERRKQILLYCTPLIFNNIALWINAFLDKYFITAICGSSVNGVYAVANKIPTILSTCYTVFSQAWTLSAIKEFDKEDKDGFFSNTYSLFNAFITVMCSGIILLNIFLANFLYAKDFFEAWQYSSVLLISVMFNSLTAFLGGIFSAAKKSKSIASTTILSACINMTLNVLLIPAYGALGAAIATVASYAVMWFVRIVVLKKYIILRINLKRDCFVYFLLSLQVVLEHQKGHCYIGQALVFVMIVFIYRKYIGKLFGVVLTKCRRKLGERK